MMCSGDVISYTQMCQAEGVNLQRGMNFRLDGIYSVILMSIRSGAPYADKVENEGKVLIYEGHDVPRTLENQNPKIFDQPMFNSSGSRTQNGLFFGAAADAKERKVSIQKVKVYEKIKPGIWVYNGIFDLMDAWQETAGGRKVFKFRLELSEDSEIANYSEDVELDHNRLIPTQVKLQVWKRDKGQCVLCSSKNNLHFDHVIPFSKGGTSLEAKNVQLLCAKHNLRKRDRIE